MATVLVPSHAPAPAPRAAETLRRITEEAQAHVASLRAPVETVELVSEAHARFPLWPRASYDVAHATASGFTAAGAARHRRSAFAAAAVMGATAAANPEAYRNGGHYGSDGAVSLFTSRQVEGVFPFTSSRTGVAGRSTAFTSTGRIGTSDEGAVATGSLASVAIAPGSELSLAALFTRFLRRLRDAPGGGLSLEAYFDGARAAAAASARAVASAQRSGAGCVTSLPGMGLRVEVVAPAGVDGDLIPSHVLRAYTHSLRTALADADLEALVRCADASGGKRELVSLKVLANFALLGQP